MRVWGFTRQDSIEYAARHNIPITVTEAKPYSIDENIVGRAIECGIIEDPWVAPPEDVYEITRSVRDAPAEPLEVVLHFDRGVPVALDGAALPLHEILNELNPIVGAYGFGRLDMVENRRVGIKSRETYECPGMLALILAHADLESITLERDVAREVAARAPLLGARLRRPLVLAAARGVRRVHRLHAAPRDRRGPPAAQTRGSPSLQSSLRDLQTHPPIFATVVLGCFPGWIDDLPRQSPVHRL